MTTYGQPFMHTRPPSPLRQWLAFGAVVLLIFAAMMIWPDGCGGAR